MQAERGLSASDLKGSEVKNILETCFGQGQKARHVRDLIQGQSAAVDEGMVTCVMQGVRELAMKSGHYVEFLYERAAQVAVCSSWDWSRERTRMRGLEGELVCAAYGESLNARRCLCDAAQPAVAGHGGGALLATHEAGASWTISIRSTESSSVQCTQRPGLPRRGWQRMRHLVRIRRRIGVVTRWCH